ncbi:MAG TPA: SirB2 family protein [Thermoanaerobaculia bacterium]|jgi:hypothetical protein|nr:SirB2 family protein [Thermoanaerobaculia bacterium]
MISYTAYKVLHVLGVLLVFMAFGGMLATPANSRNKMGAIFHGLGLVILLVTGFGLMSRLGISHTALPGWVWAKALIWLIFGGIIVLIKRKPELRGMLWFLLVILGTFAAYLAIYKPF